MKASYRDTDGTMYARIQLPFYISLDTLYRAAAMEVDYKVSGGPHSPNQWAAANSMTRKSIERSLRDSVTTYGWAWAEMALEDYVSGHVPADDLIDLVVPIVDCLFPEFGNSSGVVPEPQTTSI